MVKPPAPSTISRIWDSSKRIMKDGTSLLMAIQKQQRSKPTQQIRDILLTQARQHQNSVATNMLLIDKEIGLMKYHGTFHYITQYSPLRKFQQFSFLRGSSPKTAIIQDNANATTSVTGSSTQHQDANAFNKNTTASTFMANTATKAKVAFMITATQRSLLAEMGYSPSLIKTLKPIEALLILEHDLSPPSSESSSSETSMSMSMSEFQNNLKKLVDENEELQRLQAEEVLAGSSLQTPSVPSTPPSIEEKVTSNNSTITAKDQSIPNDFVEKVPTNKNDDSMETLSVSETQPSSSLLLSLSPSPSPSPPSEDKFSSSPSASASASSKDNNAVSNLNGDHQYKDNENGNASEMWFEVVETINSKSQASPLTSIIGLYKTEKEANFCRQIKENMANRRRKDFEQPHEARTYIVRVKDEA